MTRKQMIEEILEDMSRYQCKGRAAAEKRFCGYLRGLRKTELETMYRARFGREPGEQ